MTQPIDRTNDVLHESGCIFCSRESLYKLYFGPNSGVRYCDACQVAFNGGSSSGPQPGIDAEITRRKAALKKAEQPSPPQPRPPCDACDSCGAPASDSPGGMKYVGGHIGSAFPGERLRFCRACWACGDEWEKRADRIRSRRAALAEKKAKRPDAHCNECMNRAASDAGLCASCERVNADPYLAHRMELGEKLYGVPTAHVEVGVESCMIDVNAERLAAMTPHQRRISETLRGLDRPIPRRTGPMRNRDKYGQKLSLRGWPEHDNGDS